MEEYTWSDSCKRPAEYLKDFQGPEMIKMTFDGAALDLGATVDTQKPFLLYSHRRRTKVYADMVHWEERTKKYVRSGPAVEIPKDYIGWFEVMPAWGAATSCLASLAEVRQTGCECFLTRTTLHGFSVIELHRENLTQDVELGSELQIPPGEVLKITRTCSKEWKTTSTNPDMKAETKFLECVNFHGAKIAFPLAHPGQFNIVANAYDKTNPYAVYQMSSLIGAIDIPAVIHLIFGWMPRISDTNQFKGYFRLTECKRPNSYILYQVHNETAMLTEVPFDADFHITTAQSKEAIEASRPFKKAIHFCRDTVYPFAVNIKGLEQTYRLDSDIATNNSGNGDRNGSSNANMMPQPTDMKAFRRSDVYPPLETQAVAEFWSITFKDPESVLGTVTLETPGESTDSDPAKQSPMSTIRRLARQRVREQYGMSSEETKLTLDGPNSRKPKRIEELALREAKC